MVYWWLALTSAYGHHSDGLESVVYVRLFAWNSAVDDAGSPRAGIHDDTCKPFILWCYPTVPNQSAYACEAVGRLCAVCVTWCKENPLSSTSFDIKKSPGSAVTNRVTNDVSSGNVCKGSLGTQKIAFMTFKTSNFFDRLVRISSTTFCPKLRLHVCHTAAKCSRCFWRS